MRVIRVTGTGMMAAVLLAAAAWSQTLLAVDDSFTAFEGRTLIVEDPGVLENDTLDGGELPPTAEAELVSSPSFGILDCEPDPGFLELCADGSFDYTPDPGFVGTDTFTYQVVDGLNTSNVATVTLTVTGCEPVLVAGPPAIDGFRCWIEASYLAKLTELSYASFQEGFESDAVWGVARDPETQPLVTSQDVDWTPNNLVSGITTGTGPALTGEWGVYELPHGDPTGAPTDSLRDGFMGTWTGADSLLGVGGWLTSNTGNASTRFVLDGVEVGFADPSVTSLYRFFGVIDTTGFTGFEIYETEGVVQDQEFIFADDFTFAAASLPNRPPTAVDDSYSTDQDVTLNVAAPGVLGNDSDPDGDAITAIQVTGPTNGILTLLADGSFGYTPDLGFFGTDSFTYKANDGLLDSNIATVMITVIPANRAPTAVDDAYATDEDVVLNVAAPGVLANDSDPDGDAITAIQVTAPTSGLLTLLSDGSFGYTPDPEFSGIDSFTYKANDGLADSNVATVTITVNAVNDPPVADPNGPYAGTVGVPVGFDGTASFDPDGTIVSYDWDFGDGTPGTGVTPSHTYSAAGLYTVTLTVTDDGGATDTATSSADIQEPPNNPPVAVDDAYATDEDVVLNVAAPGVLANDSDPDGDPITAIQVTAPSSGLLTLLSDGSFGYTPDPDFSGLDSFTYKANDGLADSNIATVTITVNAVNDPPVSDPNGPYSGTVGTAVGFDGTGSFDLDGTIVSYDWDFGDTGTGTGATPSHTYAAAGLFTVTLTVTDDGGATDTATSSADIQEAPNQPPVAVDDAYATDEDVVLNVAAPGVLANDSDPDGDPITAIQVTAPTSGLLTLLSDGSFGYTPDPDFSGTDSFTYKANDGLLDSNVATVTITVNAVNDPPVADPNGPYTGTVGTAVNFDGTASFDPDGTIVSYDWDFGDTNTGTGVTPTHTYATAGLYTVTLTVTDDAGATDTATSTADIQEAPNLPPIADPNGPYTGTVGTAVNFDGTASFDPDGTIVSYDWDFGDTNTGTGVTPTHTYATAGLYTVTLTVTDDAGATDTATSTADIQEAPNNPPVAVDDAYATDEDVVLNVAAPGVLANDSDPDGDPITAIQVTAPSSGLLTLLSDGSFGYTPDPDFSGLDSFTYKANDGLADSNIATVTITVNAVNDPPVSDPNGPYSGTVGTAVGFDGTGSFDLDGTIVSYDWDFGDGTPGTGVTPTHTYAAAGLYTVTLTVTDDGGATDTATSLADIQETPNLPPVADPNGPYTGTVGTAVIFDGTGSTDPDGTIVAYDWDFGDGSPGTGATPSYTYAAAGLYTVTLTVTDDAGATDTATSSADIQETPNLPPIADPNGPYTGTVGTAVIFDGTGSTDPDGTIVAYDWDFGDGNAGTGVTPSHTYSAAGLYTVTLTVTDDAGATDTATSSADIQEAPNLPPVADPNGPYSGTVGTPVGFDGTGSSDPDGTIVSYDWDFGDGNAGTGVTPSHPYAAAGLYTVTLTVTDDAGATDTATSSADIQEAPNQPPVAVDDAYATDEDVVLNVAAPGVLANDSDPDGDPITAIQVTAPSSGILTLLSDGSFGYTPDPDFNGLDSFTYKANDGLLDSNIATVTITVNAVNDPPVADPNGPYTGTVGVPVGFDGSGSFDLDGTIVSYDWDFGDGTPGTGVTPSHTYAAAGLYTVTLTVTDDAGATDTATSSADIQETPNLPPIADPNGPYTSTVGTPVIFDGTGSSDPDGTIVAYDWDFGDGTPGTGVTPSHTYATAGLYTVTLTVTDDAGATDTATSSADIQETPNLPPIADPNGPYTGTVGTAVIFDGTGSTDPDGTIVSYAWDFGDGSPGTGATPSHTYATAGLYTVTLTVTDDAGATDTATTSADIQEPPNNPPMAVDDAYATDEDVVLNVAAPGVLANDSDPDGDPITAIQVTAPSSGILTLLSDGSFGYTPDPDFNGLDLFTYKANDGLADSNVATVTITVNAVNDPPVSDPNGPYSGTVGVPVGFDGTASFDPDGTIVSYAWDFGDGNAGTGVTPSHTYAAAGLYTVTLTVTDDGGATDTATTTADIQEAPNNPPVAVDDAYATDEDVVLNVAAPGVLANDSDPDGDPITAIQVTAPSSGLLTLLSDGSFGYTPDPDFSGLDSFTYKANDGLLDSNIATVTITVNAVNDPPVADPNGPYSGTVGVPVIFDGTGSTDPDGTIVAYDWDFGDGTPGTGVTPTHTYAAAGLYTVTLTVTDDGGATDTATSLADIQETPNLPPVADPNGPYTGTVGTAVIFDGTGSTDPDGTIVAYDWDFGDGSPGTGATPSYTYAAAGLYTVTLTVTDDAGATDTATSSADIQETPNLPPIADPNGPYTGTVGTAVIFDGTGSTDPDGTIVAYDWDFGDGNAGTGVTPSHTYSAAGLYTVTLTVTDDAGATDTATSSADIQEAPNLPPVADPNGPYSGTVGTPVGFDGTGSSDPDGTIVSYDWDFGDGNAGTGVTPSHPYAAAGLYTVTLTVTDDAGATDTATSSADIQEAPNQPPVAVDDAYATDEDVVLNVAAPGVLANDSDPDGDPITAIQVTAPSSGILTLLSDGSFGYTPDPDFNGLDSFTYKANDGLLDSNIATVTITVNAVNDPPVADPNGPYTGTVGVPVGFDGSGSFDLDGTIVSYDWDFGDGTPGTGVTPSHTYAAAGLYTVTLTVTDDAGATDTATSSADIQETPNLPPIADPNGPYTSTVGTPVIFDGTGSSDPDGTIVAYDWDFGDGTPGTGVTPSHTYATAGLYTVTLTVTDDAGATDTATSSADIQETPNLPPIADPNGPYTGTVGTAVIFDGTGSTDPDGTIVSYAWDFGDGSPGTGATPSHTYATAGLYTVTLTVTDDAGATDTATSSVDIQETPNLPPIADPNGPYTGTVGTAVIFDGTGSTDPDGTIVAYDWDFGDGSPGTGATPSHTYATAGLYTVTLTVTDDAGATDTATSSADIQEAPNLPPIADPNGPYTGTVGTAVIFDGTGSTDPDGTIVSYDWDFGDGNAGTGATPSHTYATAGLYTVTLTVTDDAGATDSNIATVTISVSHGPLADAVLLATNSMFLKTDAAVLSGDVLVNEASSRPTLDEGFEILLGARVTTPDGWAVKADSVRLLNRSVVGGDLYFNELDGKGTVAGAMVTPLDLPLFQALPDFLVGEPGAGADVVVGRDGFKVLPAGEYGRLIVRRGGQLQVTGGNYEFTDILLEHRAQLTYTAATNFLVEGTLSSNSGVFIGPAEDSGGTASDLVLYSSAISRYLEDFAVSIGATSEALLNIYAPAATVRIMHDADFMGAVIARDIVLEPRAMVTLDSAFTRPTFGAVADPGDGQLTARERTGVAITELLVRFSEAVQNLPGDFEADEVTSPANYLLVADGVDGAFQTSACGAVMGDDQAMSVDRVFYDEPSLTASLLVNGFVPLPEDRYRLLVCGPTSIRDLAGNMVDDDGIGSDDYSLDFEVTLGHYLSNPNFDVDLSGWTLTSPTGTDIDHGVEDADGAVASGSARIRNFGGLGELFTVSQCIPVVEEEKYEVDGVVRVSSSVPGHPMALGGVDLFATGDCTGGVLSSVTTSLVAGDTEGAWSGFGAALVAPATSQSALVTFLVAAGQSPDFEAAFDRVVFRDLAAIVVDGFESGDTSAWSATLP